MSSNQNSSRADSQDKSQRALQALKVTIAPARNPSHTAPTTPTRPSLKQALSTSVTGLSVSTTSNKPAKESKKANNDQGIDLCPWQIPTDPDDMEDDDVSSESPRESKSEIQRKTSTKSFTNLTASGMQKARMKRSMSAKKVEKSPIPSKSPKSAASQWPKKFVTEDSNNNSQSSFRFQEKPRRSLQPVYPNVEKNESPGRKKKVKTAVGDLEFDLGIDDKCATEGEEAEPLFEERSSSKEVHLKELGPVRYSKMSEEDAATVFEMRKRELLNFLIKLGANPNLVKKKLASKNIGSLKQGDTPTHLSDMRGSTFDRERVMRTLKGTLEDNLSPNRFIVYNTDRDPLWNNPRGRFATPNKTRNRAASSKVQGKSDPPFRRRNSAKILRDKDELNIAVKKNLTASFNIVLDSELAENKSPVRVKKLRDPHLRNSHQIVLDSNDFSETKSPTKIKKSGDLTTANKNVEEKKAPMESFTIDLVKFCSDEKKKKKKKKSKKTKKNKNDEELMQQSEKQSDTNKVPSENISINTVWENQDEGLPYQKIIEAMRMKSKVVLGDIDQIDLQIQKMKEDGKKGTKNGKRGREEIVLISRNKDEKPKQIFLESLEEGYANVAKMKNAKRSGSFSVEREQFEYTPKVNGQKGVNKKLVNQRENETERLRPGQDTSRSNMSKNNRTEILDNKNKKGIQPVQGRAPSGDLDRKVKSPVEIENRKRNELELNDRRAFRNDINTPKSQLTKQALSPTNNFFGKKEVPEVSKSKVMAASEKTNAIPERKVNQVIQPQPVPAQTNDRNKLLNAFRNPSSTSSQPQNVPQRFNEETIKKSTSALSNSQVQTTSNKDLNNARLNRPVVMTNDKKQISNSSNATPTQVPSTATSNNKSPLLSKQPIKKTLTTNKSQKSFEKDSISDINESIELFEKNTTTTKTHKSTKSATKSTFSEGVKKILREGSKEDNQLPNSKTAVKNANKSPLPPGKQTTASNRPQFDIPTASDIRTKMYKEGRLNQEDGTLVKINYVQNGVVDPNKRDLKDIVMEQMRQVSTTKKANQPEIQFPQNAGRKRSLSPRSSKNLQLNKNDPQISSLQDITEKKNRGNGVEAENAERLKLLGQSVKPKREMSAGTQNKPYRQ